ncbi:cobalt ABC transporter [Bacillus sp. A053]|uniref:ABC transporter ATP-binding protein n=1 Tax=Bacillus TaxID=1386 RepID=UPI00058A04D1|nr:MULTISPECIES: ABC transporter ATP-binding protein [Bacillus]ASB60597.1 heme ABC transporter ATP-binding protein [Bacillus sp. MD-5]KIH39866.1 cobalt ABC transporter [Bacillus sp. A053]MDL9995563.1 energy-coupling factor transporter ATPase [Bacillus stercoris]
MQAFDELLTVDQLSFSYEEDEKPVFQNISFELQKGECVLLLGPSGCGKSSLALCLNGLYPEACDGIQSGHVFLFQKPVTNVETTETIAQHAGVVFQDPDQQFCMLTVEDEIAFGLENLQITKEEMTEKINAVLEKLRITHLKEKTISTLSGGQKQKVALACILAMEPELIILDEPTSLLDPFSAREFVHLMKDLQREKGFSLLVIEHQLDEWAPWIERTIVLDKSGQKALDGLTKDLFQHEAETLKKLGIAIPKVCHLQEKLSMPFTLSKETLFREPFPAGRAEKKETPSGKSVLEVRSLSFARGQQTIFEDISFSLREGSLTALVGPNGTGKSTLLSVLARLMKPQSGKILLYDQPLQQYKEKELRKRMGFVFQNPEHQFVTDTVYDELLFGQKVNAETEKKAQHLLYRFDLAHLADHHPFAVSQGQKRRLSVATMLMHDVKVLLLDEPTFGQDARTAAECMEMIQRIKAEGTAVLMVTHDMELVSSYADSVLVLHNTGLAFDGSPVQLFSQETGLAQKAKLTLPLLYEWMAYQEEVRDEAAVTSH